MKDRSLLAKKLEIFYNDIKSKRSGKMRLQTDLEFNRNKIKDFNKKFIVDVSYMASWWKSICSRTKN